MSTGTTDEQVKSPSNYMTFARNSLNKTPDRNRDTNSSFEDSKSPGDLSPKRIFRNHEITSHRANQVSEYAGRVNKGVKDQIEMAQGVLNEYHA